MSDQQNQNGTGIGRPELSDLVSLRIRSLIADKEMVTARANFDTVRTGEWQCDYARWHNQLDAEIQELFEQAKGMSRP